MGTLAIQYKLMARKMKTFVVCVRTAPMSGIFRGMIRVDHRAVDYINTPLY